MRPPGAHRILLRFHPSKVCPIHMRPTLLLVSAAVACAALGCSKNETAQARGRDAAAAKPVTIETVRLEKVKRAVDLVGTLAAVDQVTISSEAEGKVSRIQADLGDRVTAGQPLIVLDREKQQYNLDQQRATL